MPFLPSWAWGVDTWGTISFSAVESDEGQLSKEDDELIDYYGEASLQLLKEYHSTYYTVERNPQIAEGEETIADDVEISSLRLEGSECVDEDMGATLQLQLEEKELASASLPSEEQHKEISIVSSTAQLIPARNKPFIQTIPLDVLQAITSFLPPPSIVAFRLTCKPFYSSIASPELAGLDDEYNHSETHQFLDLLVRDMAVDQIACFYCTTIHTVEPKFYYGSLHSKTLSSDRICEDADQETLVHLRFFQKASHRFGFTQLQMAMKLHNLGLDPTPHLDLFRSSECVYFQDIGNVSYILTEARICESEIIYRKQSWLLMPRSFLWDRHKCGRVFRHGMNGFEFCSHHKRLSNHMQRLYKCKANHKIPNSCNRPDHSLAHHFSAPVPSTDRCELKHDTPASEICELCGGFGGCDLCEMEFNLQFNDYGDKGVGITTTVWVSLGAGLTPRDPEWMAFLNMNSDFSDGYLQTDGDIMRRFEGCEPDKFVPSLNEGQQKDLFEDCDGEGSAGRSTEEQQKVFIEESDSEGSLASSE